MTLATLIHGSAHDLSAISPGSVHACMTSPPYWGLRSYAGDQDVEWPAVTYAPMAGLPEVTVPGCDPGCVHEWTDGPVVATGRNDGDRRGIDGFAGSTHYGEAGGRKSTQGAHCIHCGGWRGPLGLEPDPLAYVGHLVLVFREVWRVLRDDGCIFVNLGDSYNGSGGAGGDYNPGGSKAGQPKFPGRNLSALKPKDLCMIPARVALALQADGWTLRSDIIWAKGLSFLPHYAGSVMPESVRDRPTKGHEYVWLLSKGPRYYWDAEAVKEESSDDEYRTVGKVRQFLDAHCVVDPEKGRTKMGLSNQPGGRGTRNLRTVWAINPRPYAGAHFAVWPPDLVRPMVLASTSARGVCPACGSPWRRVVERTAENHMARVDRQVATGGAMSGGVGKVLPDTTVATLGWQPTCACDAGDPIPATILDPFSGSGTTGQVALALGRRYIGVDIAGDVYHDTLAAERLGNLQMEMSL